MIPGDRFLLDGDTAWWVDNSPMRRHDRPCKTCDGKSWLTETRACPDCIDGRHTFDIEVDEPSGCGECDPWSSHLLSEGGDYGETCQTIRCTSHSPTTKLRVSIVPGMVLPIHDVWGLPLLLPESGVVLDIGGKGTWITDIVNRDLRQLRPVERVLTLPSAAAVGMWAVKLAVQRMTPQSAVGNVVPLHRPVRVSPNYPSLHGRREPVEPLVVITLTQAQQIASIVQCPTVHSDAAREAAIAILLGDT